MPNGWRDNLDNLLEYKANEMNNVDAIISNIQKLHIRHFAKKGTKCLHTVHIGQAYYVHYC